ncbi:MAG: DUF58 domain-containing protein [Opitutaceae bacterium]|jgi:uncharacterized protein (DUF58 family)|nr:DUF58 domain-containing protein [Opitutaceae bacterium]
MSAAARTLPGDAGRGREGDGHRDGHREGLQAARRYRLPFGRRAWRGLQGNWPGAGAGSSIDFQDHRAYQPGDDPRYIHWAAYARTGQLSTKLYRAEMSPLVDLVVDESESMRLTPAKAARVDALVAFCVESAALAGVAGGAGASLRLHAVNGHAAVVRAVPVELARAGRWREGGGPPVRRSGSGSGSPEVRPSGGPGALPWRPSAMKVLVSDLLYPCDPLPLVSAMAAGGGVPVILAPALAEEAEPPGGRGNMELVDCETGERRRQRIDDALATRYCAAYERHFALWEEACRRRGVAFARVGGSDATPLAEALAGAPLAQGCVELMPAA